MLESSKTKKDFYYRKNSIPLFLRKIKKLNLNNIKELIQINDLSQSIYKEWLDIRCNYKIINPHFFINEKYIAEFEAEEELIVSLLFLLNEKIINFVIDNNK